MYFSEVESIYLIKSCDKFIKGIHLFEADTKDLPPY
jgi:hypothetical protein